MSRTFHHLLIFSSYLINNFFKFSCFFIFFQIWLSFDFWISSKSNIFSIALYWFDPWCYPIGIFSMDYRLPTSSRYWTYWYLWLFSSINNNIFRHNRLFSHTWLWMFTSSFENRSWLDSEISNFFQSSIDYAIGILFG